MKKVITLLLLLGVAGGAFAQSDRDRAAGVILGGGAPGAERYPQGQYPSGNRQEEINAINRDYDAQVASVQANLALTPAERERRVQVLNRERARRINAVNRRYDGNSRDRDDNRNHDKKEKRKYKKNGKDNGNHYGWEKGKANPHGNGRNKKNKDRNDD